MSVTFVTATGTDVGKTFLTAGMIRYFRDGRIPVDALKPVATGFDDDAPEWTDTAVLLGDTAVPTWNASRHGLAFVFGSSATLAASGMQLVLSPTAETGPARALAVAGVVTVAFVAVPRAQRIGRAEESPDILSGLARTVLHLHAGAALCWVGVIYLQLSV